MKYISIIIFLVFHIKSGISQEISEWNQIRYGHGQTQIILLDVGQVALGFQTNQDSLYCNEMPFLYTSNLQSTSNKLKTIFAILNEDKQPEVLHEYSAGNFNVFFHDLARDTIGNFYLTVSTYGSSITLNNTTIHSQPDSSTNFGVIKISPAGQLLYLKIFKNARLLNSKIETLTNGRLAIAGTADYTSFDMDDFYLPCFGCTSHDSDVIVAILDSETGQVLRAGRCGSDSWDFVNQMIVSSDNFLYVTGGYRKGFDCGGDILPDPTGCDAFLLKFDTTLVLDWARAIQGPGYDEGRVLAEGSDGAIYWGADYTGTSVTTGDTTMSGGSGENAVLCRLSSDGQFEWVQNYAAELLDFRALAVDENHTVWAGINFLGDLTSSDTSVATIYSDDSREGALLRLDGISGIEQACYAYTGNRFDAFTAIQALADHQLLLTGSYGSDTSTLLNMTLYNDDEYASRFFWAYLDYPAVGTSEPAPDAALAVRPRPNPARHDEPLTLVVPENTGQAFVVVRADGRLYGRLAVPPGARELMAPAGYFAPGVYWIKGITGAGLPLTGKIVVY